MSKGALIGGFNSVADCKPHDESSIEAGPLSCAGFVFRCRYHFGKFFTSKWTRQGQLFEALLFSVMLSTVALEMRPVVLLSAVINTSCLIGLMGNLSLDQFVVMSFINPLGEPSCYHGLLPTSVRSKELCSSWMKHDNAFPRRSLLFQRELQRGRPAQWSGRKPKQLEISVGCPERPVGRILACTHQPIGGTFWRLRSCVRRGHTTAGSPLVTWVLLWF